MLSFLAVARHLFSRISEARHSRSCHFEVSQIHFDFVFWPSLVDTVEQPVSKVENDRVPPKTNPLSTHRVITPYIPVDEPETNLFLFIFGTTGPKRSVSTYEVRTLI